MDTIQSKITFGVVDTRPFLCVMPANLSTTERKRLTDSLAVESPIWWVSKMICQLQPSNPTNQLAFWTFLHFKRKLKPTIVSAIEFCSRTILVTTKALQLVKWRQQRPPILRSVNSIAALWKINEPASFLNVPTMQAKIEAPHRICNRILL